MSGRHPSSVQSTLALDNPLELAGECRVRVLLLPPEDHLTAVADLPGLVASPLVVNGLRLGTDMPLDGWIEECVDDVGLLGGVLGERVRPLDRKSVV